VDQTNVTDVDGDLEEVIAGGDTDHRGLTEPDSVNGFSFESFTLDDLSSPDGDDREAEETAVTTDDLDSSANMLLKEADPLGPEFDVEGPIELSATALLDSAVPREAPETAPDWAGVVSADPVEVVGYVRRPTHRERRVAKRLRARKVRRLIRHVDPWTVLKVSFLFYLSMFTVSVIAGVLLWTAAVDAGTIAGTEDFIKDLFAFETFRFDADQIFRSSVLGGIALVFGVTALTVLLAVLFNLISDLVGGIRLTVIEEETARPRRPLS